MKIRLYILCILFLIASFNMYGQSYPTGLNPPDIKWRMIENEKVKVIYPESLESTAKSMGSLVTLLHDYPYYNLGPLKKKVPILLQNQTVISNGFVTVGPFRSEFFTTGPQFNFSGAASWMHLLAIHEYRHVQQFTNAQIGVNRLVSLFFGEYAWAAMAGLALPRWFFEGDAVYVETALTPSGRGRTPEFVNEYRAVFQQRKIYGYEKASAGSFRDFVPDHYTLGYFLTSSIRQNYDSLTWPAIFSQAVRYNGLFYPFSRAMRKETGKRTPQMYKNSMQKIDALWRNEEKAHPSIDFKALFENKSRIVTSYTSPVKISDTTLLYVKSAYNQINTLYTYDIYRKIEKKINEPGLYLPSNERFSVVNNEIVWSQITFDKRWGNKDYSDILLYSIDNQQKSTITTKGRYFSPILSFDGLKIAAIHMGEDRTVSLRILDKSLGTIIKSISLTDWEDASFPVWQNDHTLYFIGKKENHNGIVRLNLEKEKLELISEMWTEQLGHLVCAGDTLLFTGTFTNRENIYALLLASKEIYQLTNSRFGARQPAIVGNELVFSEFSATGYKLSTVALDSALWQLVNGPFTPIYFIDEQKHTPLKYRYPEDSLAFTSKPFSYIFDIPRFHSAVHYVLPPILGIQAFANNLSTNWSGTAAFLYNQNEQKSSFLFTTEYSVFFPVLRLSAAKGERSRYTPIYSEETLGEETQGTLSIESNQWDETSFGGSVILPLNLSAGNYFSKLWWTNTLQYTILNYFDSRLGDDDGFLSYATLISLSALKRKAKQHIHPRLGLQFDLSYEKTIGTTFNDSYCFQSEAKAYYPGLFRTHGGWIAAAYRSEPFNSSYKFSDTFFYTRGLGAPVYDQIVRYSFNYSFPIVYPDLPLLGPVLFLKRIKANVFYDYSYADIEPLQIKSLRAITPVQLTRTFAPARSTFQSFGFELTTDSRIFRMLEADMGVRFSYHSGIDSPTVEFILFSVAL